jgi:hypothetical protein
VAGDLRGDNTEGVCLYVIGSGALDRGWCGTGPRGAPGRASAWRLHGYTCGSRATPGSRRRAFSHVSSASGAGGVRLRHRAPGAASLLEQRRAAAEQRRWDSTTHHSRRDGSRRQVNTWAYLWRGVVTGGQPVTGNLAGEDTWARSRGNLGEEGVDKRAPSVSDGDAVTSWQAGLVCGDGPGSATSWAGSGESGPRRFSNLNLFPIE